MSVGKIEVSEKIAAQDLKVLEKGIEEHTKNQNAPELIETPLSVLRRDNEGRLVAGLYGKTFWDWLYVDTLWVDDALRSQDVGRNLMDLAEEEARKRGCVGVFLWTQSFDAPKFYPKIGYKEFVVWDDFPINHQRHGFMKRIAA